MKFGSRMDVFVPARGRAHRAGPATAPWPGRPCSAGGRAPRRSGSVAEDAAAPGLGPEDGPASPHPGDDAGVCCAGAASGSLRTPGAEVVSLRQLSTREKLRVTSPSMFTAANMACGFSAVPLAFNDHSQWAAALMTVAIVMDIADGAVARLVGATSPFGVQLDSLADLISFGLAPAVLVYTWVLPEWPVIAWFAAYFWLACAGVPARAVQLHHRPDRRQALLRGHAEPRRRGRRDRHRGRPGHPASSRSGRRSCSPACISVVPALLMVSTVRFRRSATWSPRGPGRRRSSPACVGGAFVAGTGARAGGHAARGRLLLRAHRAARRAHPPGAGSHLRPGLRRAATAAAAVGVLADRLGAPDRRRRRSERLSRCS